MGAHGVSLDSHGTNGGGDKGRVFTRLGYSPKPSPYARPPLPSSANTKFTRNPVSHQTTNIPKPYANPHRSSKKWERTTAGAKEDGSPISRTKPEVVGVIQNEKVCEYWMQGKCCYGDKCRYLHQWFSSTEKNGFALLKQFSGHEKGITELSLPSGYHYMLSGSKDGSVRIWDLHTFELTSTVDFGGPIRCMMSEAGWIFVATLDAVVAFDSHADKRHTLDGSVGQVEVMSKGRGMLLAGNQKGDIFVWRFNATSGLFELKPSLKGHAHGVVSLVFGSKCLYSGSIDATIKVWNLETLECIQTLTQQHKAAVTSLVCWEDKYIISSSLDKSLKMWAMAETTGSLAVKFTHKEEHGVFALNGMSDAKGKDVLMCSCNNDTVYLYDLPSFNKRGTIFSNADIRAIGVSQPEGLFCTGDTKGGLRLWKWSDDVTSAAPS